MSAATAPSIPPRPVRSQKEAAPTSPSKDIPIIPPRPARRPDRSQSPDRDSYARSPLNQSSFAIGRSNQGGGGLYSHSQNASSSSLPPRPPSVSLPTIGQEGNEYANFYEAPQVSESTASLNAPKETRNVGQDVKLHAPKPALPTASANARIATVTRTDSNQAAAAGFGKAHGDDREPHARSLRAKASFASQDSAASTERPSSAQPGETEHGIPEIGQRVPMYPHAGDVQAPSPSPHPQIFPAGIGYHNNGQHRADRHHGRQRSGIETLPPGSYGLHGHGTPVQDRFEKAWYEKHPEALLREEHGEYGPGIGGGRGEFALSSEDLNKIVRDSRGIGLGTSPAVVSTPNEQIGFAASEEYASRLAQSRPGSSSHHHVALSNASQSHIESPLRKTSFPADITGKQDLSDTLKAHGLRSQVDEDALDTEVDEDVIHVDPPSRRVSKVGGGGYDPPTEDLGPHGGNHEEGGGWLDERGYGTPILASDEVAKEKGAEFLQPAIEPHQELRGNDYYAGIDSEHPPSYMTGHVKTGSRGSSISGSRPTSRPPSITGGLPGLSRFAHFDEQEQIGTPLEDVEEYEPLFPEDDAEGLKSGRKSKPETASDRLKRPEISKHKFPSQDIWEDTPSSAQLQAIVTTPDLPSQEPEAVKDPDDARTGPAAIAAQRTHEMEKQEMPASLSGEHKMWAQAQLPPHLRDDASHRSPSKQRFPSRDIWEDTPDSLRLQTIVTTPQIDEPRSPPEPAEGSGLRLQDRKDGTLPNAKSSGVNDENRPIHFDGSEQSAVDIASPKSGNKDDVNATTATPTVPARPAQRLRQAPLSKRDTGLEETPSSPGAERRAPAVPGRPKPQVPARPARPSARDSSESIPLSKQTSAASAKSVGSVASDEGDSSKNAPPAPKPKPAVPARPNNGKLAALKAGFMSDLDKRLQIGPQGTKPPGRPSGAAEKEDEKEKPPLTDARKGRARGPTRRKPGASPSGTEEVLTQKDSNKFGICDPRALWQIDHAGSVLLGLDETAPINRGSETSKAQQGNTPTLATNTAGDAVHDAHEVPDEARKVSQASSILQDQQRANELAHEKETLASDVSNAANAAHEVPKASENPPIRGVQLESNNEPLIMGPEAEEEDADFRSTKLANTAETSIPTARAEADADETADSGRNGIE
ncbi:MAG: hypothetical protein M1817_002977 [Caeruleum heppii]|nr:MAG: hypothetical protein M1817_002977 [Caeruleum heppii]